MFIITQLITQLCANIIFSQALGTSTIIIAARNKKNLAFAACTIMLFTTAGSSLAYFADKVISSENQNWLMLCYVSIIALLYVCALTLLWLINKNIFNKAKLYIHISAFNCAVVGSMLMAHNKAVGMHIFYTYFKSGLEAGIGFLLASLILTAAYKNLNSSKVPASFRGFPAMLVYIGIISMALYALK